LVVFDVFRDEGEILGLYRVEQICKAIVFAALDHLVTDFRINKMHVANLKFKIVDFIVLKDRGNFLKSLSVYGLSRSGDRDF
jgi:hypothetical protein